MTMFVYRPYIEQLEGRDLLTATFSWDGTDLTINGDSADNEFTISTNSSSSITVTDSVDGEQDVFVFPVGDTTDDVVHFIVNLKGGDDVLNRWNQGILSFLQSFQGLIVSGGSGDDTINGTIRDDSLTGGGGNDVINAYSGLDSLDGGAGDDTLYGGPGADHLTGGNGHDFIYGEAGGDVAYGGYGNDLLEGGSGNDTLIGDYGADVLRGDGGTDWLYAVNLTYSVDGEEDKLVDDGVDNLTYDSLEDSLI